MILKDYEQESCFILMFWAMAIMGFKARQSLRGVGSDQQLIQVSEGMNILPEDAVNICGQFRRCRLSSENFCWPDYC